MHHHRGLAHGSHVDASRRRVDLDHVLVLLSILQVLSRHLKHVSLFIGNLQIYNIKCEVFD